MIFLNFVRTSETVFYASMHNIHTEAFMTMPSEGNIIVCIFVIHSGTNIINEKRIIKILLHFCYKYLK